jgi:hypothetical protein
MKRRLGHQVTSPVDWAMCMPTAYYLRNCTSKSAKCSAAVCAFFKNVRWEASRTGNTVTNRFSDCEVLILVIIQFCRVTNRFVVLAIFHTQHNKYYGDLLIAGVRHCHRPEMSHQSIGGRADLLLLLYKFISP